MNKETKTLIYSMINNIVIAISKIIVGIIYDMTSLFADGLHTMSDFITDIICMIGSKLAKKRPTKYHPFGFGKIEYLTNLFVGTILFLLGIFIIINSFGKKSFTPPLEILWFIGLTFILKYIAISIMHKVGRDINSELLITSVKESQTDLASTLLVGIITILLQFEKSFPILKYADMAGSIIIGLFVLKTAIKIILSNSLSLIGEVETDKEELAKVNKFLEKYKYIKDYKFELIKYGSYYQMQLQVAFDNNISLRRLINLENKLKREIKKHYSLKIKYINIYTNSEDKI